MQDKTQTIKQLQLALLGPG